jgi:glycosyltransferase involved in cell wall biosynthesis
VTVDGCGCPEIVSAGDNGYLFEPGNIDDLTEKMLMAVEKPHRGLRARRAVEECFDIYENSLKYVELYCQMTSSA